MNLIIYPKAEVLVWGACSEIRLKLWILQNLGRVIVMWVEGRFQSRDRQLSSYLRLGKLYDT